MSRRPIFQDRWLTNEIQKIADALPFTKGKQIEIVLFTKVAPNEDVGNSILPQEVIDGRLIKFYETLHTQSASTRTDAKPRAMKLASIAEVRRVLQVLG